MIQVRELYKYYGEKKAVGPLSFTIDQGEIVGLLGLNGAGKTTALRVLACDLLPSSGTVKVEGLDVVDQPDEVRKRIGYLPDTPPLYADMTVSEYLTFAAQLRGMSRSEAVRRAGATCESTQLTPVADDRISSLSHGYRQRVGIAQAIVHEPRLVILDEPISGLDPVQIIEMRQLLRSLRGAHTILLSSHILNEISETCDRLLVLKDGEFVAMGTEQELSQRLVSGARIEVTARGTADAVRAALRKVRGVTEVEPQSSRDAGAVSFLVVADRDVREDLGRALFENHLGLLELTRVERELESVFMRLTGSPKASETEASASSSEAGPAHEEMNP